MLAKWTMTAKGVRRLLGLLAVITILSDITGVQAVRIGAPPQKLRLKGKIMRAPQKINNSLIKWIQEFGYAKSVLNFELLNK